MPYLRRKLGLWLKGRDDHLRLHSGLVLGRSAIVIVVVVVVIVFLLVVCCRCLEVLRSLVFVWPAMLQSLMVS